MNQFMDRFIKLPRSQRAAAFVGIYILLVILAWFGLISGTIDETTNLENKLTTLRNESGQVKERAANRKAFEERLARLEGQLKRAMTQLPDESEIPALLSDIDASARKSGLEVRKFQPLGEVKQEYYAEVPVQIAMEGSFHEVGVFFDRVAKMNRIVSAKDIVLGDVREESNEASLQVSGKVVTFRYLTDAEMLQEKEDKKKKKGGK